MERRRLGGSGAEVSRVILGCGNFGGIGSAPAFFGQGESEDEARALMDAAWAAGITTFDTADAYGGGRSEAWIGRWQAESGHEPVLSTKVFHSTRGDPDDRGLAPERIHRQLTGSLARLGVARVDLYLVHEPDPETPVRDTLRALDELVQEGRVGGIGASNVDAPRLAPGQHRLQHLGADFQRDVQVEVVLRLELEGHVERLEESQVRTIVEPVEGVQLRVARPVLLSPISSVPTSGRPRKSS